MKFDTEWAVPSLWHSFGFFSPRGRFPPEEEKSFLLEYRSEGVRWSSYACFSAILILALFVVFPGLSNRYTVEATLFRVFLVLVLFLVQISLIWFRSWAISNYLWLIGGACSIVLGGLLWLILYPGFESVSAGFSVLPVAMFFLFLLYGFLRLPIAIALFLGCLLSVATSAVAYSEFPGGGWYRVLMYLILENVLGCLLLASIEARERRVFRQALDSRAAQVSAVARAESAERAYEDKIRLISAINHDLRQPMLAINAHSGAIRRKIVGLQSADVQSAVQNLGDAVQFLNLALDNLLAAARYESGAEPVVLEPVLISDLLASAVDIVAVDARARGLDVRVRLPDFRIELETDRASMIRVLINLLSNALKFTENKNNAASGVVVFVGLRNGVCKIAVADTGVGIPADFLSVIFEPYSKAGREVLGRDSGLGLGLFLVKAALSRLHGHSISVRSRVGRGSRFTVSAPGRIFLGASNREICSSDLDNLMISQLNGAYVLLLERSELNRRAMTGLLEDWGVVVSCASCATVLIANEAESERSVDAILIGLDESKVLSAGDLNSLVALLPVGVDPVFMLGTVGRGAEGSLGDPKYKILQKPFPPQDLALAILAGVDENRRIEGEV